VIRAGYGIFYDNPSLALGFLANAFDGAESSLIEAGGGAPCVLPGIAATSTIHSISRLSCHEHFPGHANGNITGCSTAVPATMCYLPRSSDSISSSLILSSPVSATGISTRSSRRASFGPGYPLTVLPFTIPVQKNFKFGYAQQANLTIEREITKDWKISAGYNYTHGVHLDRTATLM